MHRPRDVVLIKLKFAGGSHFSRPCVFWFSPLGLEHIAAEDSTNDGIVHDPLIRVVPKVFG